jgi:hypothetical protein
MSSGISETLRQYTSAQDVVEGKRCHCGEHRTHQELHVMTNTAIELHRHNEPCSKKPLNASEEQRKIALTPEHFERAQRIAKHENKTVEQVVTDAMTILWVRHATKNGW